MGSNNHGPGPGEIANCYSIGRVEGTARVGGLAGHNNGEIADSFWDVQTSGLTTSDGGNGKTTAQMQSARTFLEAGWDLIDEDANGTENIWRVCEAASYPRLILFAPTGSQEVISCSSQSAGLRKTATPATTTVRARTLISQAL